MPCKTYCAIQLLYRPFINSRKDIGFLTALFNPS